MAVERDGLQIRTGQGGLEMGAAPILEAGEVTGVFEFGDAEIASGLDPLQRLAALVDEARFAHAAPSPNRVESR